MTTESAQVYAIYIITLYYVEITGYVVSIITQLFYERWAASNAMANTGDKPNIDRRSTGDRLEIDK